MVTGNNLMEEDWRNAFRILMCAEICDGASSTCSSLFLMLMNDNWPLFSLGVCDMNVWSCQLITTEVQPKSSFFCLFFFFFVNACAYLAHPLFSVTLGVNTLCLWTSRVAGDTVPAVLGCMGWVCIHEFFSRGQKVILLSIANAPWDSSGINYCDQSLRKLQDCLTKPTIFVLSCKSFRPIWQLSSKLSIAKF